MKLLNPRWIKEKHVHRYACQLIGAQSSYDEPKIFIDYSAAKTHLMLNKLGYTTIFHCSGVKSEHKLPNTKYVEKQIAKFSKMFGTSLDQTRAEYAKQSIPDSRRAYIAFDNKYPGIKSIIPKEMDYEESICLGYGEISIIRINKKIPDGKVIKIWKKFEKNLEKILTQGA